MVLSHLHFFWLREQSSIHHQAALQEQSLICLEQRQDRENGPTTEEIPIRVSLHASHQGYAGSPPGSLSRASPCIILCPVAAPDNCLFPPRNRIFECLTWQNRAWSFSLQQNIGCSKESAFQCLPGYSCLESHCTDWHALFFSQSYLIIAMLASQEAFSYTSRSQAD